MPVLFDPSADLPFTVPKGLFSHALAYALTGVIAGLMVQFGRSVFVRSWLHVPVLAFLAANAAATLFAADSLLALYGTHDRMIGLGTIADGVVLYFAIVLLVRTRAEALAVGGSFFGGSALVLLYELIQLVGRDPFSWSVDGALRPFSTIGQTTNLAEYMTVVAVGAGVFAIFSGGLRGSVRALLLVHSGLSLAGVVVTQTRSALIGLVAGVCVLLLLTWLSHPSRRARLISLLGAAGGSAVLAILLAFTPLGARFLSTVEISAAAEGEEGPRLEESANTRVALYRMAFDMVRDRPAFGYGPDNFLAAMPRYRSDKEPFEAQESPNSSAHGWFAQVGATSGLVGLLTFLAIPGLAMGMTFRNGFRPAAWAAAGMLIAFLGAGLTTVNGVGTDWLFWAAAGAIASTTRRPDSADRASTSTVRRVGIAWRSVVSKERRAIGFGVSALGVVMALSVLGAMDASRSAEASQAARFQGRAQQAIDAGLRATRSDPFRAQYWDTLGLAYVSANRLTDAASAFEQATRLAPYDVRYSGDLARAYVLLIQQGDSAAAVRAREVAERGVQVDPNNPLANQTRALVMQVTGDLPEALKSVERALELDKKNNRDIYLTGTQVLLGLGRANDAITIARRGIALIPSPQNQIPLRIELARALLANREPAAALVEIDMALAIQPNLAIAQQLRAEIQAALRNSG